MATVPAAVNKRSRKLKWGKHNYHDFLKVNLKGSRMCSRASRRKTAASRDRLYPIKVVQTDGDRVKVHYIGYSDIYDEWKNKDELEDLTPTTSGATAESSGTSTSSSYQPYSLHEDLEFRVKKSITCSRTASPKVVIVMPIDVLLFNGGLKMAGKPTKKVGGVQYFGIDEYRDLNHLLGTNWHVCGLNGHGDYGYAIKNTVQFYIRKYRPLMEYVPSPNGTTKCKLDMGFYLCFSFTQGYGNSTTFGKDSNIFC